MNFSFPQCLLYIPLSIFVHNIWRRVQITHFSLACSLLIKQNRNESCSNTLGLTHCSCLYSYKTYAFFFSRSAAICCFMPCYVLEAQLCLSLRSPLTHTGKNLDNNGCHGSYGVTQSLTPRAVYKVDNILNACSTLINQTYMRISWICYTLSVLNFKH